MNEPNRKPSNAYASDAGPEPELPRRRWISTYQRGRLVFLSGCAYLGACVFVINRQVVLGGAMVNAPVVVLWVYGFVRARRQRSD
jgi:hypothetical protein